MSKGKAAPPRVPVQNAPLTIKIQDEDWVLITGSPQALTELATRILMVATGLSDHVTMDHPGPELTADSTYGLYVWRESGSR
jgi:hypothetical protein